MDPDSQKVKRSLRFSFIDGLFASGMSGFTQDYFVPFLLLMGGNARQVGFLSAIPNLLSSLAQIKSADLVERLRSRQKVINSFVFVQALMLLLIALLAFFHEARVFALIVLATLFSTSGSIATTAWGSLMSDLVSHTRRGEYFGWRSKVLGFVTVFAAFTAGSVLHIVKGFDTFYGFAVIFGCAFLFRLMSWSFLKKMHEPVLENSRKDYFSIIDFISRIRESNYAKFVIYVSLLNFAVNVAAPFFAVFMLRDLHFGYLTYTIVTVTSTLTIYLSSKRWGMHADKVGNIKVLRLASRYIIIVPLLWLVSRNPVYLMFAQVVSGFFWAGFNLSVTNFIFDACSPAKRTRCIAYFTLFNGLFLFAGAITGGFLVQKLPYLFGSRILMLMLISAVLRALVVFLTPLKLKEVRQVSRISSNSLIFSVLGLRPVLGNSRTGSTH